MNGEPLTGAAVTERFVDALNDFVEKVRPDRSIVAVILSGSLAYDKVWRKSDIDLTVVVRDQTLDVKEFCIVEDDILINASVTTHTDFKRTLSRMRGGEFTHSFFARSKIVYTKDESLYALLEDAQRLGGDDRDFAFFNGCSFLIGLMEKVEKWLVVRDNLLYAQYYILKIADELASLKLISDGKIPSRESVLRVMDYDPAFIAPFYTAPLTGNMDADAVRACLARANTFLAANTGMLLRTVERFMQPGEIMTTTALSKLMGIPPSAAFHTLEFLTCTDAVEMASETIRMLPKGTKCVEEAGFIYIKAECGEV